MRRARFGADHELLMLCLVGLVRSRDSSKPRLAVNASHLVAVAAEHLETQWFDNDMRAKIRDYHAEFLRTVDTGNDDAADRLQEGLELQQLIYTQVRG